MMDRRKAFMKMNRKKKVSLPTSTKATTTKTTIDGGGNGGATSVETSHGVSWVRLGLLGQGSFGSVFLAKRKTPINQETSLPSLLAVKSATMEKASSLKHEKQILCDLTASPIVLQCYGDEVTELSNGEKIYNLLLEFGSGFTLFRQIKMSGLGLPESYVRLYTHDIVRGLKYINCRGYVHCDIKPSNILLMFGSGERAWSFVAKIADSGLAKPVHEEVDEGSTFRRGTYRYMSPELVKDNILGCAADIWALGCSVVEMLSGEPAWPEMLVHDLKCTIGYGTDVPHVSCNISDDAKDFLGKCLARNAADRWPADRLLEHPFLFPD